MRTSAFQVIRRPIITEKGLTAKENLHTVVFEVAPRGTKTQIKEAVQKIFKVKVAAVPVGPPQELRRPDQHRDGDVELGHGVRRPPLEHHHGGPLAGQQARP